VPEYRRRFLDEPQTDAPLDALRGGFMMRKDRASAIHAQGDRVLAHGRRILCQAGLHGSRQWHVSDDAAGLALHPSPTDERVVLRTPAIALTPGHFPRAVLIALPSGMTEGPLADPTDKGHFGKVKITIDLDNGATSTVTKTIEIPASKLANAAQPTGSGAAWANLHRRRSSLFLPPVDLKIPSNLAAWCDGVTATITVAYIGAPRVIDFVVYEEPIAFAADISAGPWPMPLHASAGGTNLGQLPGAVPLIKRSASDDGHGAECVVDAAARQVQELGPVLWSLTAWTEALQSFTAQEADYQAITGTGWTELISAATTAYNAAEAGAVVGSGANARRVQDSAAALVMRDKDNVVPVRCYVYGAMSTAAGNPTARVRFETGADSVCEIEVPAGKGYAWRSAPGTLRCGLGAQDAGVLQVRAKVSTAGPEFRWRYLLVVYRRPD